MTADHMESLARIEQSLETHRLRLEAIERRLGTPDETETDFEDAREIAHKLSNLQGLLALTKTRPLPV